MRASGSRWLVRAKYVFENKAAEEVTLQVGFPERACDGDCDEADPYSFRNLKTWVRGRQVKHRVGTFKESEGLKWAPKK